MKKPSGMNLLGGETVLWYGRRSLKSLIGLFIIGILTLWICGLGIIFFIAALLKWWQTEYAITNRRVYSKIGLISRSVHDAPLERVTDATLRQSFFGRLLNFGTVGINTAGMGGYEIVFAGVSNPVDVRLKVQAAIEEYKRGMRIQERTEELELKYLAGEITREQFETAKRRLEGMTFPKTTVTEKSEMKSCPQCGCMMRRDSKFCPNCGAKLEEY